MRDLFAIAKFLVVMADKILFKKIEDLFLSPLMTQVHEARVTPIHET